MDKSSCRPCSQRDDPAPRHGPLGERLSLLPCRPHACELPGKRITINLEDPQVVFDDIDNTLTEEEQPVLEAIAALG